ncbi:Interferon-inducible GTPase (IIGP) [Branchiostoma belcheri]|nr:Interferon-inducible GTPase (IIGP) [Branchiostoma belcheri]
MTSGHTVTLDKVRILDTEQDYFVRGVKEAVYIRAHQPSLNRDGGRYRLPATFDALLTSSRFRLPETSGLREDGFNLFKDNGVHLPKETRYEFSFKCSLSVPNNAVPFRSKPVPQRRRPGEVRVGVVGDPEYPHPDRPDGLVLIDFPGVLLRRHAGRFGDFNIGQYLLEFGSYMRSCDVFLVFCRGRIQHNPVSIALAAHRMGKRVLFVRSQFDKDVADKENDDPEYFDDKCSVHLMEELRQDYIRVLRDVGWPRDVSDDEVFIISGRLEYVTQDMWDALELKNAIFGQSR